ncbi:methyl-accepting chemotaxis protein [Agaribacter flavus]|uniref:Methyl-accepting chemotaxis protein n=1 Tax=Agaribacter flavus TaxID=1902781 RepID=A0ABV7FSI9_9ALTE
MKNWSIQKMFSVLFVSLIVLLIINIVGMLTIAKTAYFTFLEREHIVEIIKIRDAVGNIQLASHADQISTRPTLIENANTVIAAAKSAKKQAELCLDAVLPIEVVLFNLLGFGEAIDICKASLDNREALVSLATDLKQTKLSALDFVQDVEAPLKIAEEHSLKFAAIVPEIRHFMVTLIVSMSVLFAIVLLIGAYMLMKQIKSQLFLLRDDISMLEKSNKLSYATQGFSNNEIGTVAESLSRLLQKFAALIGKVIASNTSLSDESKKLAQLAEDSNESVATQFTMTNEISDSIGHITAAIQDVDDKIMSVADNAKNVDQSAESGRSAMETTSAELSVLSSDVTSAANVVSELAQSGENVAKVIEVIEQIAEQTNLLALNAAIEAARAGEHGRGFAVVSDEVRTLATRTQNSTKEISDIIEQFKAHSSSAVAAMNKSQSQAAQTIEKADEANAALTAIKALSTQINTSAEHVADSAKEQNRVLNGINQNLGQLRDIAKNAKEISSKTKETALAVNQNVDKLDAVVLEFTL